jgi:hypothetical protein
MSSHFSDTSLPTADLPSLTAPEFEYPPANQADIMEN